jgi:trigger factor
LWCFQTPIYIFSTQLIITDKGLPMKFDSQIEEVNPTICKVTFTVPTEEVNRALQESYRQIGQNVRIKGFRQGHVPIKVLQQNPRYRKAVEEDVIHKFQHECLKDLLKSNKIIMLSDPTFDHSEINHGQDFSFSIEFETRPKLNLDLISSLEVPYELVLVENSDIDAVIDEKREALSRQKPVERAAQLGDMVKLMVSYPEQTSPTDNKSSEEREYVLGKERLRPEIEEALIGICKGENRAITMSQSLQNPNITESEQTEAENATPNISLIITAKEICEIIVPDVDDEFDRDNGYDNLEEMRQDIRRTLEEREKKYSDERTQAAIINMLIEQLSVTVPPKLLQKQIESKREYLQKLQSILGENHPHIAQQQANIEPDALLEIQQEFVIQQLIDDLKLSTSREEIDEEILKIAAQGKRPLAQVRSSYGEKERESLQNKLTRQKALSYLLENVKKLENKISYSEYIRQSYEKELEATSKLLPKPPEQIEQADSSPQQTEQTEQTEQIEQADSSPQQTEQTEQTEQIEQADSSPQQTEQKD